MTPLQKTILNQIQWHFPLTPAPYAELADTVNAPPEQVVAAIAELRKAGIIRRIGGSFVARGLGYLSTLVGASVQPHRLEAVASLAAAFPEVTHNYERQGQFNLWFTIIAENQARLDHILASVSACPGVTSLHNLPALQTFKIQVDFQFADPALAGTAPQPAAPQAAPDPALNPAAAPPLDELDRRIITRACGDLPAGPQPFRAMAAELDIETAELLRRLRQYQQTGRMRRLGAVLRHHNAGYVANGMSVWNVPGDRIADVAKLLTGRAEISHCYERPRFADWPYNLFAMIHGRSPLTCQQVIRDLSRTSGISDCSLLFSLREFKKSSMLYFAPQPRLTRV